MKGHLFCSKHFKYFSKDFKYFTKNITKPVQYLLKDTLLLLRIFLTTFHILRVHGQFVHFPSSYLIFFCNKAPKMKPESYHQNNNTPTNKYQSVKMFCCSKKILTFNSCTLLGSCKKSLEF